MSFRVEEEGTVLVGEFPTSVGTYVGRMRWSTPAELEANRAEAERMMRELVDEKGESMRIGEGHRVRGLRWGFSLYVGSGPPTWWKPRLRYERHGDSLVAGGGWLRRAYLLRVPRP